LTRRLPKKQSIYFDSLIQGSTFDTWNDYLEALHQKPKLGEKGARIIYVNKKAKAKEKLKERSKGNEEPAKTSTAPPSTTALISSTSNEHTVPAPTSTIVSSSTITANSSSSSSSYSADSLCPLPEEMEMCCSSHGMDISSSDPFVMEYTGNKENKENTENKENMDATQTEQQSKSRQMKEVEELAKKEALLSTTAHRRTRQKKVDYKALAAAGRRNLQTLDS
jgi:hypothetical protein